MKRVLSLALTALVIQNIAYAIPQEFLAAGGGGGLLANAAAPQLDGQDFSIAFVDDEAWRKNELPGEWQEISGVDGEIVVAMARVPKLFGAYPQAVYAASDEKKKLKAISILYIDAGAYFGYERADGLETDQEQRERQARIRKRKQEFGKAFKSVSEAVEKDLKDRSGKRPDKMRIGHTDVLRTECLSYTVGGFALRYSRYDGHAVTLTIVPQGAAVDHYLDERIAGMNVKERRRELEAHVTRGASGDTLVDGVPVFRQGLRPYCAINTLGMVTHYLGLRLGVTGLAAGAKFKNTGSAKGTKLLDLYRAAAEESEAKMSRSGKADMARIKRAIDNGCPVLVWRRFSPERDQLHTRFAREFQHSPDAKLPEPTRDEIATWPGDEAPGHCSVVVGYNEERGEVIFMESWGEHVRNRRMRVEELEGTSYMTFYFKV
ncbi:MAG: C39 family peptidase [Verrucomicrobiales bacterium]